MSEFWCPSRGSGTTETSAYRVLTCAIERRRQSLGKSGERSARRFVARIGTTDERFELGPIGW
jgi:hypothetical protein